MALSKIKLANKRWRHEQRRKRIRDRLEKRELDFERETRAKLRRQKIVDQE